MTDDPAGLYARLGVDAAASPEAIAAAFRLKARVLHPDVVGTGDAAAFIRMKEAYDVLADAGRRAAYDRAARAAAVVAEPAAAPVAEPVVRGPRWSDLPIGLWAGLGGVTCLAALMAVVQFSRPLPPLPPPVALPFAPSVAPAPRPPPVRSSVPLGVPAGGATTHFIIPAGGAALLWRRDPTRDAFLPVRELAVFSPVRALGLVPEHGLVEVRLPDGGSGFVDAARLAPGDGAAAHRAYCTYNAGPSPQNGEILGGGGGGGRRQVRIANRSEEPAVVKLRDASGRNVATVFVQPGSSAIVGNLPDGNYRPEYAIGELWSRACNDFAAGTRAQRFAGFAPLSALSTLLIPPDLSVDPAPVDIPDAAFERE